MRCFHQSMYFWTAVQSKLWFAVQCKWTLNYKKMYSNATIPEAFWRSGHRVERTGTNYLGPQWPGRPGNGHWLWRPPRCLLRLAFQQTVVCPWTSYWQGFWKKKWLVDKLSFKTICNQNGDKLVYWKRTTACYLMLPFGKLPDIPLSDFRYQLFGSPLALK